MNVSLIIQARMNSTRLPGKIMMPIMGRPVLEYQLERLAQVRNINNITIATTTNTADQSIVNLANKLGFNYYRGSELDVLGRFYCTAKEIGANIVVRCNSDCPLIDPEVVDHIIKNAINSKYDYVSNILRPTYPTGMHVEVFSFDVLERAYLGAIDPIEREHVTPYIYRRPEIFLMKNIELNKDLSFHRWTLDYSEDLEFITRIFEYLYPNKPLFSMSDVLRAIEKNPEWFALNGHIKKSATV